MLRRPFINNNEVSNRLIVVRDRREAVLFRMKSICSLFREFRFESFVSRVLIVMQRMVESKFPNALA